VEKVIYLLWRDPAEDAEAAAARLRSGLTPRLREIGVRALQINVADAAVAAAAKLRQTVLAPPPDALLQVWVDSAITALREPVDRAVAAVAPRYAAYRVTESQPLRNLRHPPSAGQRTEGFAQIALLRRPARLARPQWLAIWHDHHTLVAVETQSTFEYLQNSVVDALTPDAPAIDAIVEECFPLAAMTDPHVFFDAVGDERRLRNNLKRMMDSVGRFLDAGTIDVIPTSQYRMFGFCD
jgi:hypothetical protein